MPIDPQTVQSSLQALFPDATIDPNVVARVQAALGAGKSTAPPVVAAATTGFRYYIGDATHARTRGTTSIFTTVRLGCVFRRENVHAMDIPIIHCRRPCRRR